MQTEISGYLVKWRNLWSDVKQGILPCPDNQKVELKADITKYKTALNTPIDKATALFILASLSTHKLLPNQAASNENILKQVWDDFYQDLKHFSGNVFLEAAREYRRTTSLKFLTITDFIVLADVIAEKHSNILYCMESAFSKKPIQPVFDKQGVELQYTERTDKISKMLAQGLGMSEIFESIVNESDPKPKFTKEQREARTRLYMTLGAPEDLSQFNNIAGTTK